MAFCQVCMLRSVIIWFVLYMSLLHLGANVPVHMKYTSSKIKGQVLPEELNVTLSTGSGTPTYLLLKRIQQASAGFPVYTLNVDKDGTHILKQELLDDNKNIGYYEGVSEQANIEVTRVDDCKGVVPQLRLKGLLNVKGRMYLLSPEETTKTGTLSKSSQSSDILYSLTPQVTPRLDSDVYVVQSPAEERKGVKFVEPKLEPISTVQL